MGDNINFLFWNIHNEDLSKPLSELVNEYSINILGLAEVPDNNEIESILAKYNFKKFDTTGCNKVKIFSKYENYIINPLRDTYYYSINEILFDDKKSIIFGIVHFPSKLHNNTEDDLQEMAIRLKKDIEIVEFNCGHNNTIIFGDFNMNPFEKGFVAANSLHAISSSEESLRNKRTVKGEDYSIFYNPMWCKFNDKNKMPGSYYYQSSNLVAYFWNIFDQVIIRPNLINYFDYNALQFITETKSIKLVDDKNKPFISDHLPLNFSIKRSFI